MNEIAQRYGEGLFELARETNTVNTKKENIETLLSVLRGEKDVIPFLRAVKITKKEKKEFIKTVFGNVVDQDVLSLIQLMVDKGRTLYIQGALESYLLYADDELGITKGIVYSARALDKSDMDKLKEALEKKVGGKVSITNHVDESLIAGIKVKIGNNVTDMTMKNKIEELKQTLLKGGLA